MKTRRLISLCLYTAFLAGCADDAVETPDTPDPLPQEEYSNDNPVSGESDVKIEVVKASGTKGGNNNPLTAEEIGMTCDGDQTTIYRGGQPATFVYEFAGDQALDYCVVYPYTPSGGYYAAWGATEVYVLEKEGEDFVKVYEQDLGRSGQPVTFPFEGRKNLKAVKFVVKDGGQGWVGLAEIEFFHRSDALFDALTLFKDQTCSELKDGITEEEIAACPEPFYRTIAEAMYNDTYPRMFRIQEFQAYPEPGIHGKENLINSFSRYENPAGIFVSSGEKLTCFVGDIPPGESVGLKVREWGGPSKTYPLREGFNQLSISDKGLVYVQYHTAHTNVAPVKIHFATGKVNGYFDIAKHTQEQWNEIISNASYDFFDILGRRTHIVFSSDDFRNNCPDPFALMEEYDRMVDLEEEYCGMIKYNRPLTNRITVCYNNGTGGAMAAGDGQITWNNSKGLSIPTATTATALHDSPWGLAHELGHELQLRPGRSRYEGMLEVTNNLLSAYIQRVYNGPESSRLYTSLTSGSDYNSEFERAMCYYQAEGRPHNYNMNGTRTVLTKLIPLWQLYIYAAEVEGKDWFKDYYQRLLTDEYAGENGAAQLQVVRIFCEISGENLLDFFEHSGFLTPTNDVTDKNEKTKFVVTQLMIDELKREIEAKGLPKPEVEIWRLTDQTENIEAFRNKSAVQKGTATRSGGTYTMTGWKNVAAYEVYTNGKLVFVSPHSSFTVPSGDINGSTYVNAVSATGEPTKVNFN